jgi:hypothetical protein
MMNNLPLIEDGREDGNFSSLGFDLGYVNVSQIVTYAGEWRFHGTKPTSVGVIGFGFRILIFLQDSPDPTGGVGPNFVRFIDFASSATFILHGDMIVDWLKKVNDYSHSLFSSSNTLTV